MFTGLVQSLGTVVDINDHNTLRTLAIDLNGNSPSHPNQKIEIGSSIAINGVCLTVTELSPEHTCFDCVSETLRVTNLGHIRIGDSVNVERSLVVGDELGGHNVSGHVDGVGFISDVNLAHSSARVAITLGPDWGRYLFRKGFIAINGISLTIAEANRSAGELIVYLIPETLRRTTFGTIVQMPKEKWREVTLNFEIERSTQVIVDTIRDTLTESRDRP